VTIIAVSIGLAVIFVTVNYLLQTSETKTTCKDSAIRIHLPPLLFGSMKEFMDVFFGLYSPEIVVDRVRQLKTRIVRVPKLPFMSAPFIILTDHQSARKILEDPKSTKFGMSTALFVDIARGSNFITEEGHRWKHVRKQTSPAFSSKNIKLMVETISSVTDKWIEGFLEPSIKAGRGIDILKEANRITADVISKVAFDHDFTNSEREQFLRDLLNCWIVFGSAAPQNLLKQFKLTRLAFSDVREAMRASKRMVSLCEKILQAYREKSVKQPHKLIHMINEDPEYDTDTERVRDMVMYAIGGFDTTSNAIAFALLELARYPEEQTRLRKALQKCETDEEARYSPALKYVARETLRLHPPAFGSVRVCSRDYIFENYHDDKAATKTLVPKGAVCITHSYAIQRDGMVFKDPDCFDPARWVSPSDDMMKSLFTFSLGRRNCQGQALAYAELHEIISKLCRKYEFGIVKEGEAQTMVLSKPVGTILSAKIATK